MSADFRMILKNETHAEHEGVDKLISTIDLQTRGGFICFLQIHRDCFYAMQSVVECSGTLDDILVGIDADLVTLGGGSDPRVFPATDLPQLDTLAVDYVLEGSRLGSQVLKRRWAASNDALVRTADKYFAIQPVPGRWREVCATLSLVQADSARAARIVEDTKRLFALFHHVAEQRCEIQDPWLEPTV